MATKKRTVYENPLVTRNASATMCEFFSPQRRIEAWRRVWIALAEAQRELGLAITASQIAQLKRAASDIDFDRAARYEAKTRHDVMAHLHTFGDAAPAARGILHLGATSMDIVDNADLIVMRGALDWIAGWLANVIDAFGTFARAHRALPTLGFTHFQPAQLTTVGKRACLWCHEFSRDLEEIELRRKQLPFRGIRGATGTQATFLSLLGSAAKVQRLEKLVAKKLGFTRIEPVTGQTYSRKIDAQIGCALAGIATSAHKFCNDLRLLANLKELEEPFGKKQVGSSAMAYKRNPMLCERATGLSRYVLSLAASPMQTAAEQWLERTLDDSSNKRLSIPEAFLATDGILRIVTTVARGMVVYSKTIQARVEAELPFMATEEILMEAVNSALERGDRKAANRQALHERIREHSHAAAREVKMKGKPNDLIARLRTDPAFAHVDLAGALDAKRYIGLSVEQTNAFLRQSVGPVRRRYKRDLDRPVDLQV
ncbi:MAG: adenylosuccinate lyase [Phycisphaerae bacterium]|nr:adenylosuccinate lyase [Phycisphaerae bacterium]